VDRCKVDFDALEWNESLDCEQNSLVYLVRPRGEGICHTRNSQGIDRNCYYRRPDLDTGGLEHLNP